MLNLFRRHVAACPSHGKRTGQKCQRKPRCPIHYVGVDGEGTIHKPQVLIDPLTGGSITDWARACEIVLARETPTPILPQEDRVTIETAIGHFLKVRETKSAGTHRSTRRVMTLFEKFMQTAPRNYRFITEVRFPDLTDFCSGWTLANSTKMTDLWCLTSFLRYCQRADFTVKYIGEGLFRTLNWSNGSEPREPFSADELESIWGALPKLANEYCRVGQQTVRQTEAFIYLMRYTGMDVSTTMTLPKCNVRGNQILTYRLKNGSEVWTVIPEWVVQKLAEAPHDSQDYFFWTGEGNPAGRAWKWFRRFRKLLDLAGLPHRSPHNFRHHFAVEHLLSGTPIEDVSRLLGHNDIRVTIKSYAAWVKLRQEKLEQQQRRVWESDPLHQRMVGK